MTLRWLRRMGVGPTLRTVGHLCALVFATWLSPEQRGYAQTPPRCPLAFEQSFRELLAVELAPGAPHANQVALTCRDAQATVSVRHDERVLERSVALTTDDAARWLALAASELLRTKLAPAPRAPAPTPRLYALRAAARLRYGDEPRVARGGAELAFSRTYSRLELTVGLRAESGAGVVRQGVRVRASDLTVAVFAAYVQVLGPLSLSYGIGIGSGFTRLAAQSDRPTLRSQDVTRGFVSTIGVLGARAPIGKGIALISELEAAYQLPAVEGRTEAREALFTREPWFVAIQLGARFAW